MEAAEDEKTEIAQAQADPVDPDLSKQKPQAKNLNVCKFFLMGKCHFGDRCRLSHSTSVLAHQKPVQTEEKECKKSKTRRNTGKTDKVKVEESKGPEKKLRMRTADDVISRILWDSSVDPADFIVGHLDRFLGVLERPFSDFSWDTQVCDCDYSEEMAIPRHRIQYFTYKGQRVWDRDSRTDHVFGSTGQSVMSPFDRGAPPQDNVAADTADGEELSVEKNEQDSINYDLTGAANEETFGDTGGTLDSSVNIQIDKDCEDAGLAQVAEGLSVSPENKQITTQDEWTDSWDKEDAKVEEAEPAQPIPQEPLPGRKPRKPTHFICFRVNSPAALRAFQLIQRKVLTHFPQSESSWVKPETLHVTLSLLFLQGPEEVFAASELLRSVVKNFYKPPISVSFTPKLKHFNGKVLNVAPQPCADVQNLNAPIQEAFREKGWLHRDSRNPIYHLTLAKVTEADGERIFEEVWRVKLDKQLNFGKLTVDKLHLCVMGAPRTADGFYETVCSVQLPTV
ncbi:leukocyte receptor cluster member 9 isoform 2-T2 [Clarias gariepinus]|uniref:leukocyte receptor cluster member 9 isoform X2 n=1 Tax=Clarias gariepinus TaxID=13013 RepID=UPI00234CB4F6|nr:leukocyte receptor cluster member 9 isoform X2 [Clarias gariepinus]